MRVIKREIEKVLLELFSSNKVKLEINSQRTEDEIIKIIKADDGWVDDNWDSDPEWFAYNHKNKETYLEWIRVTNIDTVERWSRRNINHVRLEIERLGNSIKKFEKKLITL